MIKRKSSALFMMAMLSWVLTGCQPQEGPAEKAGKAIDQTISNAGEQIQKAGNGIQDAAREGQK